MDRSTQSASAHPDFHLITKELIRFHDKTGKSKGIDLSIQVIRHELIDPAGRKAVLGRAKVFVIHEADLMTAEAQNALLKTLEEPLGTTAIILDILLMVKFTDIGAYFGGKALGRRKLIPWLSPGKTWEGLACGLLAAGAVGIAFTPQISQLTWYKALIFGILIGAVGQLGDLFESMMKRDAEVKDSGRLIPGFGGILDVIDSPLLAAPFAYLLFSLF